MKVCDEPAAYGVQESTEHFAGRVISCVTDAVHMPDGDTANRDYLRHPGSVGIIALDERDRVLLLRQYRHPPRQLLWEPPAGILDVEDEPALATAQRELFEEAHLRAADWLVLADVYTTPGCSDEALRIFLARGLSVPPQARHVGVHEEADMPIEWVPLAEAVAKVLAGELHNPTAVVGILATSAAKADGFAGLRPAGAPWPGR